jgi:S-adenosyl methyltransferase
MPPSVPRIVTIPKIDTSVPHSARFWNYLVGGKDNFEADRRAAEQVIAAVPVVAAVARSAREFLGRCVRYITAEGGIQQFLDIGTGVPTANNTHEVAQSIAPSSRVVYVDNDPIVLAHARSLLTSAPDGATSYVAADVRDPASILVEAAHTLDLSEPVAIMLLFILNFVPDIDQVRDIVSRLLAAVPSGSYLAVAHPAADMDPAMAEGARRWNQLAPEPLTLRTRAQVASFLDGLEVLEPGVVTLNEWRPDSTTSPVLLPGYAGVGRKP